MKHLANFSRADVATALLVLAGSAPFALQHLRGLWGTDEYRFFPLVLAAAAALLYLRWPASASCEAGKLRRGGDIWLIAAFSFIAAGTFLWIPWLAAVGAVLSVRGLLVRFAGRPQVTQLTSAWLLLWLLVPPPYGLDALLRSSLQLLSSRAAGEVLDLCGFNHLLQGNTIRVPGQQFFVEEACSGVHSLFALTVLAAIYVVWTRRPLVHAVLLLLAAVFWAFLLNMSRIAVVVIVRLVLDADISTGWQHELLGIVLFVAALLLLLSTDHALSFFLERSPQPVMHHSRQAGGASDRTRRTLLPDPTYRIFFAVLAGSFGMVGFLQILPYVLHRQTAAPPSAEGRQLAAVIRQSDLPATNGGWSQAKFEKVVRQAGHAYDFGEYSDTWTYRDRDLTVLCSLDYPFAGWHDLRVCYRGQGWQIVETEYEFLDDEWSTCVIELTLKRGANEYGHVSYVVFDRKSQSIPPYSAVFELGRPSWHVIRSTVLKRLIRFGVTDYTSFQFQAFTFSSSPLSDSQLTRTRTLFLQLLRTVRPRVVR